MNKQIYITTFIENVNQIKPFIENGADNLIIEHPKFSKLYRRNNTEYDNNYIHKVNEDSSKYDNNYIHKVNEDSSKYDNNYIHKVNEDSSKYDNYIHKVNEDSSKYDNNYIHLERLINEIRNVDANKKIIFNIDIMSHNYVFDKINELFSFLSKNTVNTIRVMDIGIVNYILTNYPNFKIQLNTETGNNNYVAIKFWKDTLGENFDNILLSKELDYKDITDIINKTNINSEIQVHGFLMLLYTKRRVLKDYINSIGDDNQIYIELKEQLRKEDYYPIIDNEHGSFMLHSRLLNLIEEIPIINGSGVNSLLIDLRGYPINTIAKTINAYYTAIKEYIHIDNKNDWNSKDYQNLIPKVDRGYFKGFFHQNNTDKTSKKSVSYTIDNEKENDNNANSSNYIYVGKLVDIVKEKTVAIKLKRPISIENVLFIDTPEGHFIRHKPTFIKNINGDIVDETDEDGIFLINWKKGFVIKSNVYLLSEKT